MYQSLYIYIYIHIRMYINMLYTCKVIMYTSGTTAAPKGPLGETVDSAAVFLMVSFPRFKS